MEENRVCIEFESRSQNEGFARVAVSAFVSQLDPTIEEIADVKTAVSEAVTNSIIHGYENYEKGIIKIESTISGREVSISITDYGKGIDDQEWALLLWKALWIVYKLKVKRIKALELL